MLTGYWFGSDTIDRRVKYADEYNTNRLVLETNAEETQRRIELLLTIFEDETGIKLTKYSSGWRPSTVNESTSNAAKASHHLLANAGDVMDTPDGHFAWWCFHNQEVLQSHALWMEHPAATVLGHSTPWCHLQTLPPGSGLRCYHPSQGSVTIWTAFLKSGRKAPGDTFA